MANNIDDILDEGKKQLGELQKQLESLVGTAEKVAGAKIDEASLKAEELIAQAKVHAENAKTLIDAKSKEVMDSDDYKNLESEGKKVLDDAQTAIADLSVKATEMANEFNEKLKGLFGNK